VKISKWLDSIICGDCLIEMAKMPAQSVDIVITDPPYGITSNKWDVLFDLEVWWREVMRVCSGTIIVTAGQPFTSKIVMSNIDNFRHEWIWHKNAGSNFANTVREPFKEHESILVFSLGKWTYNPQMQTRSKSGAARVKTPVCSFTSSENYRQFSRVETKMRSELRVPSSVQKFNRECGLHPTQKPLSLMRYLVRTYTNVGDIVLDPFAGSGTTCRAAMKEGRHYIGIEKELRYVKIAKQRTIGVSGFGV
jgi:site-specific DNA-methyltransferase (adenine-specific)